MYYENVYRKKNTSHVSPLSVVKCSGFVIVLFCDVSCRSNLGRAVFRDCGLS